MLRERAKDATAFVALNQYYADFMANYAAIDRERIHVIPQGSSWPATATANGPTAVREFVIGYFARICEDKGLHHLVDAFTLLAMIWDSPAIVFCAAGYLGASDRPYLERLQAKLCAAGLQDRFHYAGELDRVGKIDFLQSLDVMSVPTVYRESKGLSILEAWANAVPVALPAHGTFPELVEDTGGGLMHEPENPHALAATLKQLILDPERSAEHGRAGQAAICATPTS